MTNKELFEGLSKLIKSIEPDFNFDVFELEQGHDGLHSFTEMTFKIGKLKERKLINSYDKRTTPEESSEQLYKICLYFLISIFERLSIKYENGEFIQGVKI
jgi:hypothetical protein